MQSEEVLVAVTISLATEQISFSRYLLLFVRHRRHRRQNNNYIYPNCHVLLQPETLLRTNWVNLCIVVMGKVVGWWMIRLRWMLR